MIVKERRMPIYLRQLEALLRRLPVHHPKRNIIAENIAKYKAGYKGERAVDYSLSFLPEQDYSILHDIRLFDQNHYFQIDTIIISPRFLLFLEIKNIVGTLLFDSTFNQLIRISEEKSEGFPDPILQMKRQELQLQKWLRLYGFSKFPIESFVVISTPRTVVKSSDDNLSNKIIHSANLPHKIKWLEIKYKKKTIYNINELIQRMMMEHSPLQQNVLEKYQMKKEELLKGVLCEKCTSIPMVKVKKGWYCSKCNTVSKDAHKCALQDYALLIETVATNSKLKEFLNIQSSSIMKRILQLLKIPYVGENKGRKYDLTMYQ
ncbi:nuclease [Bacillus anthracis]|uniref:nuclease-related domain-containing protein n=1 Tax=Bacillus tropicus TaxID=2026188 RepID=UPI000BF4DDFC|nr:nuclease [Bacillus anthracis]PFD86435.1 nuclease [Bacillus anthracis]PFR12185.1 nuclease [Bacillus anthracis]PFT24476.1 nuclease [Bacillus thuringiensis]PGZ32481.1 nuclease [Bacillus anthracis]